MLLPLTVLIGLLATGVTFIVVGGRRFVRSRRWTRTTGTVVGSRMSVGNSLDAGGVIAPTMRYVVDGGRVHQVASMMKDNITVYDRGRQLPIRYDPDQPGRAVVDVAGQNGLAACLVGLAVAVFGLAGLVAFAVTR